MKRKILFLSNSPSLYTGFARNLKELLTYLYKKYNDKYEFIVAAAGMPYSHIDFERYPWTTHGVIPNNPAELGDMANNPDAMRFVSYGGFAFEMIVKKYKPDVIVGIEDQWGLDHLRDKEFFKHIPTILWVTLDSLPILPSALECALQTKYYLVWSSFAEKAMKRENPEKYSHVETQYPCINTSKFFRLPDNKVQELKLEHNLPADSFIIGFVFRNQLRKLVNKLIEGYALFKNQNPQVKNSFLHLHTNFSEQPGQSWDIIKLCREYKVPLEEVLATYISRTTKKYFIKNFVGENIDDPITGEKKSLCTVNVQFGTSEEDLNEIYNLYDLYLHNATSGSCEQPCVEAAASGRIIATSNYAFGEDIISLNKGSIPIAFDYYHEIQTHFLKSNQKPESVASAIEKVYQMSYTKKILLGQESRNWATTHYSIETNAEKIIDRISKIPQHTWNFVSEVQQKNPNAQIPPTSSNEEWVKFLYSKILNVEVKSDDEGYLSWITNLNQGQSRRDIEQYFRNVAAQDNSKIGKSLTLKDFIEETGRKRFLLVLKESIGDILMATSLLKSLSESYPNVDVYFACEPQFHEILDGNPYIFKTIPWHASMDSEIMATGRGTDKGLFDHYCNIAVSTQKILNYLTNNNLSLNTK